MTQILARFKEPSSWAGIAVLISVAGNLIGIPAGASELIVNAGASICALAAFFMTEKGQ
jgi:uncharacterized membrane protein